MNIPNEKIAIGKTIITSLIVLKCLMSKIDGFNSESISPFRSLNDEIHPPHTSSSKQNNNRNNDYEDQREF